MVLAQRDIKSDGKAICLKQLFTKYPVNQRNSVLKDLRVAEHWEGRAVWRTPRMRMYVAWPRAVGVPRRLKSGVSEAEEGYDKRIVLFTVHCPSTSAQVHTARLGAESYVQLRVGEFFFFNYGFYSLWESTFKHHLALSQKSPYWSDLELNLITVFF